MKKIFKSIVLLSFAIIFSVCLSGCSLMGTDNYNVESSFTTVQGDDFTLREIYDAYLDATGRIESEYSFETFLLDFYINAETESDSIVAISNGLRSSVSIFCALELGYSAGSGVLYDISSDGSAYIITNYHVVYDTDKQDISSYITCYLYGLEYTDFAIPAHYVGGSMSYDLAVLYVDASPVIRSNYENLKAVTFADSDSIKVGQIAIAIGNPEGEGISATTGTVSVKSETINMTAVDNVSIISMRVIRIDTAVNGGNSGGGLFDSNGNLIGIVNAKIEDTAIEGMAYAIPSNLVKAVVENILRNSTTKQVQKAVLGLEINIDEINYITTDSGALDYEEKVVIYSVSGFASNSGYTDNGEKSSLKKGDIINSVTLNFSQDSKADLTVVVNKSYQISELLLQASIGDIVTFNVTSGGVTKNINYTITSSIITSVV